MADCRGINTANLLTLCSLNKASSEELVCYVLFRGKVAWSDQHYPHFRLAALFCQSD
jgi:hypothetical protein